MNGNNTPNRAALDAAGGIFLAATLIYLCLYGRDMLNGAHNIDWSLLRALCLIGLLTLGISFYETLVKS